MLLRTTLTSPYGRKALIAAHHLGLMHGIVVVPADTLDPNDPLVGDNPLGKMPVLVLDDGRPLYDSPVILEHLDHLAGGGAILPRDWDLRIACLTTQALADGILDAALLILYEGRRPEPLQDGQWVERQRSKITRGLRALAAEPPDSSQVDVGSITVACMLSHLDRRKQVEWRAEFVELATWLDAFRRTTAAFDATTV